METQENGQQESGKKCECAMCTTETPALDAMTKLTREELLSGNYKHLGSQLAAEGRELLEKMRTECELLGFMLGDMEQLGCEGDERYIVPFVFLARKEEESRKSAGRIMEKVMASLSKSKPEEAGQAQEVNNAEESAETKGEEKAA